MIDALQRAHARMMSTLPVRTHVRVDPVTREYRDKISAAHTVTPLKVRRGVLKPVELRGVRYESVELAAHALKISATAVCYRIRRGLGRYL